MGLTQQNGRSGWIKGELAPFGGARLPPNNQQLLPESFGNELPTSVGRFEKKQDFQFPSKLGIQNL